MPINNITQTMSTISPPPHRGVDVQTVFVNKQEDFQDHLADITIDELNTLKDQLNTRIGEINSTTTTMNGYADTASAGASTATTKAGEASASASEALSSKNQAGTFKLNASTSASTATTKAGEASASALSASASASTATTKAGEASASASTATTKAGEASASALSASASASTATTKASEASASALSASTSASTATTKAGEASASASQALTSRNQAEAFAQQASASALSVDVNNLVHRTGNETIAGIKTFSSNIVGNITGNSGTATTANALNTANSYIGAAFTANTGAFRTQNWGGTATDGVTYYGNANSYIYKNVGSWIFNNEQSGYENTLNTNGNIVTANGGTWSINASSASALIGDETTWATYRSHSVANMLGWKNYGNGHCIFDASAGTTPYGVAVNNTNPISPWSPTFPTLMGFNGGQTYGVRVDSARVADSTTYAVAFTTVVGSAPSYACRAWVNFNGAGTVAIRASGNVSSITDNGTGDYTVNFTTAMPDEKYTFNGNARQIDGWGTGNNFVGVDLIGTGSVATPMLSTSLRVGVQPAAGGMFDSPIVSVSIFR